MHFTALLAAITAATTLVHNTVAHGVHNPEDLARRDQTWAKHKRSLGNCDSVLQKRDLAQRAVERRANIARTAREARGLEEKPFLRRRDLNDLESWGNQTHASNLTAFAESNLLFGSDSYACVLTPEITQGPYYIDGEYFRTNTTEDQAGVPLYLDLQFIDVNTCEPVPNIYVDSWAANATGVYSGVAEDGNGNGDDLSNLDTTFLRGVAKTNSDGVAHFETIFPGHYEGRATHVHIVTHKGGYIADNGTFHGGAITEVAQLFFDEELRSLVEAVEPYNTNTQDVTTNIGDMWAPEQASGEYDPFPEYLLLSDDISDGVVAWITIGVDTTANYSSTVDVAGYLTADGGVVNEDFSLGGGSGSGGAPSGSMSGGMPSGTMIPSSSAA